MFAEIDTNISCIDRADKQLCSSYTSVVSAVNYDLNWMKIEQHLLVSLWIVKDCFESIRLTLLANSVSGKNVEGL